LGAYLISIKSHPCGPPGHSSTSSLIVSSQSASVLYTRSIMSNARDIRPRQDDASLLATSPSASFNSPSSHSSAFNRTVPVNAKPLKPFATEDIKVLLLENVNQTGREILSQQGYQVEFLKSSLPEDQLIEKIRWVPI
jgi:D-3-phosphoglycerate dehydrogenase